MYKINKIFTYILKKKKKGNEIEFSILPIKRRILTRTIEITLNYSFYHFPWINPFYCTNYRLNKDESVTAALCVPKNCDFQGRKYRYSYSSYFWPLSSEVDKGG